jgi:drug/metabolite transporter (DMT)-like permease
MNDILMMDRSKMNMTKHGKQCATSYMLLSTCCIAAVALIAKQSTLIFGLNQAILLRFLLPLLCLGTALMVCRKKINQSRHLKLHSIRACLVTGSEYCLFYYITKTTLLNGALLINTTPIFMTLIALSLDKKKPSTRTLLGMAVGFAGLPVC